MRTFTFSALFAVLGFVSFAHADVPLKQQISNVKAACQSDMSQLCYDVNPGNGRMAACLASKEDQLTPGCKSAWVDTRANISQQIDKTEVAFRKDCGSDVQKFCSDVPTGRGRILSCLNKHEESVSKSCKGLQARVKKKFDEFIVG